MKVFIPDFVSRYACVHGPLADRAQIKVSGSQLTREREVTSTPSGIANGAALAGQRPSVRETRRHRKRCVVMNATGLGILEGNSPQGQRGNQSTCFARYKKPDRAFEALASAQKQTPTGNYQMGS